MIYEITMYGFTGTVQQLSQTDFVVKINNQEVNISLQAEEWNDGFEYTPQEIAFTQALDEIEEEAE